MAIATARIAVEGLERDLTPARLALREAIATARATTDPMLALLPLIPFVPRRAAGALADRAFGFTTDLPVSVSNMGTQPEAIARPDGTRAHTVLVRGVDRRAPRASLERRGGLLSVFAIVVDDQLTLTAVGWAPGSATTTGLRDALAATLAGLGVQGVMV